MTNVFERAHSFLTMIQA